MHAVKTAGTDLKLPALLFGNGFILNAFLIYTKATFREQSSRKYEPTSYRVTFVNPTEVSGMNVSAGGATWGWFSVLRLEAGGWLLYVFVFLDNAPREGSSSESCMLPIVWFFLTLTLLVLYEEDMKRLGQKHARFVWRQETDTSSKTRHVWCMSVCVLACVHVWIHAYKQVAHTVGVFDTCTLTGKTLDENHSTLENL